MSQNNGNINDLIARMGNTHVGEASKIYKPITSKRQLSALARTLKKETKAALNKKYGTQRSRRRKGTKTRAVSMNIVPNATLRNKHMAPKAKKTRKNRVRTFEQKVKAARKKIVEEYRMRAMEAQKKANLASKRAEKLQQEAAAAAALVMPGKTRRQTKAATAMPVDNM